MDAILLARERVVLSDTAFYEIVVWHVPTPVEGCTHFYKYRLALIVKDNCVLRYDNERGKGDHRHIGSIEESIAFSSLDDLLVAFQHDVERIRP